MKLKENISQDVLKLFAITVNEDVDDIYGVRVCCIPVVVYACMHSFVDLQTPHSNETLKSVTKWVVDCPSILESLNWTYLSNNYLSISAGGDTLPLDVIFATSFFNLGDIKVDKSKINPARLSELVDMEQYNKLINGFLFQVITNNGEISYVSGVIEDNRNNRLLLKIVPTQTMFI